MRGLSIALGRLTVLHAGAYCLGVVVLAWGPRLFGPLAYLSPLLVTLGVSCRRGWIVGLEPGPWLEALATVAVAALLDAVAIFAVVMLMPVVVSVAGGFRYLTPAGIVMWFGELIVFGTMVSCFISTPFFVVSRTSNRVPSVRPGSPKTL